MEDKRLNIAVVLLFVIALVGIFDTGSYEPTGEFLGISFLDDEGEEDISCGGSEYPESFPELKCKSDEFELNEFNVGRKESCTFCLGCASQPTQNKLNKLCNKIRDEGRGLSCPSNCPKKSFFGGVQCKDCQQTSIFNIDLTCVIHFKIKCESGSGSGSKSGSQTGPGKAPPTGGGTCKKTGQSSEGPKCGGKCPDNSDYRFRTVCGVKEGQCMCRCPNSKECTDGSQCPVVTGDRYYDCVDGCCVLKSLP